VAGFKRVDFVTVFLRVDELAERRDDARGETFFTLLATGLRMATASSLCYLLTKSGQKRRERVAQLLR
jgi:hypothetical protein